MDTQAGQWFIQLLPNINQDNKAFLGNKQNLRVTKLSDKDHKDSNEIDKLSRFSSRQPS
jgi:hypothetical protein